MLRVSFVGAGNVGTRMAGRLLELGAGIVQICSRSGVPVSELNPDACDMVIVAVSDDSIAPVLAEVPRAGGALWVHTAGSVGLDVFDPAKFPRRGVLYPLQTMLKDRDTDWARVPLLIEGDDPLLQQTARAMSPSVAVLDSDSRRRLHAAAVMCCNMVMYLWSQSQRIVTDAGLSFDMLHPLMRMTLDRAIDPGPEAAITGPAKRGDLRTIRKHCDALPPDLAATYRELSRQMLAQFHPDLNL